jgi:hypothetical protein
MISDTYVATMLGPAILGSFWGISDDEQGRLTADGGGNFDGHEGRRSRDRSSGHRPRGFSHSSRVSDLFGHDVVAEAPWS